MVGGPQFFCCLGSARLKKYSVCLFTRRVCSLVKTRFPIHDTRIGPALASTGITLNFDPSQRFQPEIKKVLRFIFILFGLNVFQSYCDGIWMRQGLEMFTFRVLLH